MNWKESLVTQLKKELSIYKNKLKEVEIEIRVGQVMDDKKGKKFNTDFDAKMLSKAITNISKLDWDETWDESFRDYKSKSIRVRVGDDEEIVEIIRKKRVRNIDIKVEGEKNDLRVSVSKEKPVLDQEIKLQYDRPPIEKYRQNFQKDFFTLSITTKRRGPRKFSVVEFEIDEEHVRDTDYDLLVDRISEVLSCLPQ